MDLTPMFIGLGVLAAIFLVIYLATAAWAWKGDRKEKDPPLKGLALPEGSVRALIALLLFGGFVLFIFFGKEVVTTETTEPVIVEGAVVTYMKTELVLQGGEPLVVAGNPVTVELNTVVETKKTDDSLYTTVLAAFGTLTAAVAGFYFGNRSPKASG